jgi:predicted exporter
LQQRLAQAVQGLPVRAALFTPFVADVAGARTQPLLQAADLEHTSMAMALDALLFEQGQRWNALLPLTAPKGASINASRIRAALSTMGATDLPDVLFVDMKAESDDLYAGYLHEAILLSLGGLVAIIGLLLFVLRSPLRVLHIIAPLAAAVVTVTAGLAVFGQQMIILHLVGLLLVVAVGSNYALFFDRADHPGPPGEEIRGEPNPIDRGISPRTLASMLFANLTTVAGFGLLSFSKVSILQAMGVTVAPGVILALIYAAIFARQAHA